MHRQERMPFRVLRRSITIPSYLHIMQIAWLCTKLEALKCQSAHYPSPRPISRQHYFLNPSQHEWGEDGSVGIWVIYPCACVVIAPDRMTQGQSNAREPDARLYGWVLLLILFRILIDDGTCSTTFNALGTRMHDQGHGLARPAHWQRSPGNDNKPIHFILWTLVYILVSR
jgi:hypothetical protein